MPEVDYRPRMVYGYMVDPAQLTLARQTWPGARFRNLPLYDGEIEIRRPRAPHERVTVTVLLPHNAGDTLHAKSQQVLEAHTDFPCDVEVYVSKEDGSVSQVTDPAPVDPEPESSDTPIEEEDDDSGPDVPKSPPGRRRSR